MCVVSVMHSYVHSDNGKAVSSCWCLPGLWWSAVALVIVTRHSALVTYLSSDCCGVLLPPSPPLPRVCVSPQELQRAVQLSPDTGFEKYMYLGQLLQGEEALTATQKGVELLQQVIMDAHHSSVGCAWC